MGDVNVYFVGVSGMCGLLGDCSTVVESRSMIMFVELFEWQNGLEPESSIAISMSSLKLLILVYRVFFHASRHTMQT